MQPERPTQPEAIDEASDNAGGGRDAGMLESVVGAGADVAFPGVEQVFKPNPRALARLAQATSVVIASLLVIPDAVALIPNATNAASWFIKVVGQWMSAAVLWFVFFLAILHLMRLMVKGVIVEDGGLKLWRFARRIPWTDVQAITVEPQKFFSRVFSYRPDARQLTVFSAVKGMRKWISLYMPHYVPSFLFSQNDFDELVRAIVAKTYGYAPQGTEGIFCPAPNLVSMRKFYGGLKWQRMGMSCLIAVGLTMLLTRKAGVLYNYNAGNKELKQLNYAQAIVLYKKALEIEPTFAVAWNNEAQAEFNLGQFEQAREHWQKALLFKPDFVEAKVSLSYLYLQQRQFDKAKDMIERALNLHPKNPFALVNRADYNMRLGHTKEAIQDARLVLTQEGPAIESTKFMAKCLLAQAKLRLNDVEGALKILDTTGNLDRSPDNKEQYNKTFWYLVSSEVNLASGRIAEAEKFAESAVRRAPRSSEVKLCLANVRMRQQRFDEAASLIDEAVLIGPHNPWVPLAASHLALMRGDKIDARKQLELAVANKYQDALSLADAASLYQKLGLRDSAIYFARRSLAVEPTTEAALKVLEQGQPAGAEVAKEERTR